MPVKRLLLNPSGPFVPYRVANSKLRDRVGTAQTALYMTYRGRLNGDSDNLDKGPYVIVSGLNVIHSNSESQTVHLYTSAGVTSQVC